MDGRVLAPTSWYKIFPLCTNIAIQSLQAFWDLHYLMVWVSTCGSMVRYVFTSRSTVPGSKHLAIALLRSKWYICWLWTMYCACHHILALGRHLTLSLP